MKKLFIADITASTGTFVEQFQVGDVERRLKKDGQAYLSLTLKDRTGKIDAKVWEIPNGFHAAGGDFVKVEAETGTYREEVQLAIRRIRALAREEIQLEDFLPASKRNREEMLSDLTVLLTDVGSSHPGLREALLDLVHDLGPALMNAPAAKSNHHAWLGGLVEHTLSLIGLAERVCQHYPELDRDILIAAAVCMTSAR
jgi:3'-5' exoribonuclease